MFSHSTGYTVIQCVGVHPLDVWNCVKMAFGRVVVISEGLKLPPGCENIQKHFSFP